MIPAPFEYAVPQRLDEALMLLEAGEDAVVLAGGHSLLTGLKQRQLRPALVVDIGQLGLDFLTVDDGGDLSIGANCTQQNLADFCLHNGWRIFAEVGDKAGDPMIRARGTFVGALCAAEPGGDWAAAALALDTELEILSRQGRYRLRYEAFLEKPPSEAYLALRAIIPARHRHTPQAYHKVKHAAIGWSVASAAVLQDGDHIQIAASGAVSRPCRLSSLEAALNTKAPRSCQSDAIPAALEEHAFQGDRYAPAHWRKNRLASLLKDILSSNPFEDQNDPNSIT